MLEQLVRELIQLDVAYDGPGLPPDDQRISPADEISQQAAGWLERRLSYVLAAKVSFPPGPLRVQDAVAAAAPVAERPNVRGKTFLDCLAVCRDAVAAPILEWDRAGIIRQLLRRPIPEADRDHPPDWRPPLLYRLCELADTRFNRAMDGLDWMLVWDPIAKRLGAPRRVEVSACEFPIVELARFAYVLEGKYYFQRLLAKTARAMGWRARDVGPRGVAIENVFCDMAAVLLGLPFSRCRPDLSLASLGQLRIRTSRWYRSDARPWGLAWYLPMAFGRRGKWRREFKIIRLSLQKAAKREWPIRHWTEQWLSGAARPRWWHEPVC